MKRKLNAKDEPELSENNITRRDAAETPTFASFNLDSRLLQAINREKFTVPTHVQAKAIPLAIDGKDVLARAKTGSGKTLAYVLPILDQILKHKITGGKRAKETVALILVPTKELAMQVTNTLKTFTSFCAQVIRYENINRKEDAAVTRARLAEKPDIVIATPGRAAQLLNREELKLDTLTQLVIDEADIVLSYGYEEDLQNIAAALPTGVQKLMMSATLRTEIDTLASLFFPENAPQPMILDLSAEEANDKPTLSQYVMRTAEEDKFLLIYAIFKLQLIKGKVIVFVADVDRCYRVKLFLEQFGIRSCVLNSELPVNNRLHAVEEFNRGIYDIIIAADEHEIVGDEVSGRKKRKFEETENELDTKKFVQLDTSKCEVLNKDEEMVYEEGDNAKSKHQPKTKRMVRQDKEFGISRGIDFRHVSCVLNFDLPTSVKSYIHRIGRTARAGQSGIALSFYIPRELYRKHKPTSIEQCKDDEKVLSRIRKKQEEQEGGGKLEEWQFDMTKLEGLRYRFTDALRSVTRIAVREARTKELRQALINSEKLKRHFEENPDDLRHLRHDTETHAVRQQPHLKHLPDYLLPSGGKAAVAKNVGYVGIKKDTENGLRRRREFNKRRVKGRIARGKSLDPLKSLNARGRGRK